MTWSPREGTSCHSAAFEKKVLPLCSVVGRTNSSRWMETSSDGKLRISQSLQVKTHSIFIQINIYNCLEKSYTLFSFFNFYSWSCLVGIIQYLGTWIIVSEKEHSEFRNRSSGYQMGTNTDRWKITQSRHNLPQTIIIMFSETQSNYIIWISKIFYKNLTRGQGALITKALSRIMIRCCGSLLAVSLW